MLFKQKILSDYYAKDYLDKKASCTLPLENSEIASLEIGAVLSFLLSPQIFPKFHLFLKMKKMASLFSCLLSSRTVELGTIVE